MDEHPPASKPASIGSPPRTRHRRDEEEDMSKGFFALATMAALLAVAVPGQATVQDTEVNAR